MYRQLPRDVVEALQQDLGASRTLMDQVRLAKEDLSEHEYADVAIQVGGRPASVQISRQEFEQTITAEIDAVNALVGNVLAQADVSPQDLHALYLTGGSSSVRAVVTAMTTLIGDRPATLLDPKLVVALGAHKAAAPAPRPSFVAPWASVAEKPLARSRAQPEVDGCANAHLGVPDTSVSQRNLARLRGLPTGTFGIDRVVLAGDFHNEVGARTWNMGSPNSEFGRGFCWEVWASTGESGRAEEALPPFVLVLRAAWYDSYHDDDSPNVILLTEDVTRSVWEYQ